MSGRRGLGARAVLAALAVVALLTGGVALALARGGDDRPAPCRGMLVPAYLTPAEITALVARGDAAPGLLVVNPHNGPGAERSDAFARAIEAAQARGAQVLGYVATGYGTRPAAETEADVRRYAEWYGVDGVFLDEAAHDAARLGHYRELAGIAHAATDGGTVVLNPGVVPDRGYFAFADVIVTFEGAATEYEAALRDAPAWLGEVPARQVAHLVHAASREQALAIADRPSAAGHLYATPGGMPNPWRTVPAYLEALQDHLRRC